MGEPGETEPSFSARNVEALAGNVHLVDGRRFQRHEVPRRLARAGPHADVGAGQQRAEAGDAARGDAGALDPELGSLAQFVFGRLLHPRGDDDMLEIVAERHGLDQAELDVPVLDRRLARLEPDADWKVIVIVGPRSAKVV